MKVKFLGWGRSKFCPADKNVADDLITLEMDVKNAKKEALRIDMEGESEIRPGHGVTVIYPSGRKATYRS